MHLYSMNPAWMASKILAVAGRRSLIFSMGYKVGCARNAELMLAMIISLWNGQL